MSTENSVIEGTPLTRLDRKVIRAQVVQLAQHTNARAYQFAWDGDQKVQITGFPSGKATVEKVNVAGLSLEPRRLLTAFGVPTRWLGVGTLALALVAEVLSRVLGA